MKTISSHWEHYLDEAFDYIEKTNIVEQLCSWLTILMYWPPFKEYSLFRESLAVTKKMGLPYRYECFRQMRSLFIIQKYMKKNNPTVLIIGDGYGFLSCLIKRVYPESNIVMVDLDKMLGIQSRYCDASYCHIEELKDLSMTFDLAINIHSMMEMNEEMIAYYFEYLRSHLNGLFYCQNREKKVMIGGEVAEFSKYPWHKNDTHLVDEICPFVGRIVTPKFPFLHHLDGAIRHRLTILEECR
ncbi:hypothetical protein ACFLX3_05570 [Chloroflexota bacterium]